MIALCCKRQEINKSVSKPDGHSLSSKLSPSKSIISDISEDEIADTISIRAYDSEMLGFNLEIRIKYSWKGEWQMKKILSGRNTCAYDWGFKTVGKWLSVGYSTDRGYRDYYDIAFERSENLFYLKRHIGVYPSSTEKTYDIFDDGKMSVKSLGLKICKTDYENVILKDTMFSGIKEAKCIELPNSDEEGISSEGVLEKILGIYQLESITK